MWIIDKSDMKLSKFIGAQLHTGCVVCVRQRQCICWMSKGIARVFLTLLNLTAVRTYEKISRRHFCEAQCIPHSFICAFSFLLILCWILFSSPQKYVCVWRVFVSVCVFNSRLWASRKLKIKIQTRVWCAQTHTFPTQDRCKDLSDRINK